MKTRKRILSLLMIFTLVCGMFPFTGVTVFASTFTLVAGASVEIDGITFSFGEILVNAAGYYGYVDVSAGESVTLFIETDVEQFSSHYTVRVKADGYTFSPPLEILTNGHFSRDESGYWYNGYQYAQMITFNMPAQDLFLYLEVVPAGGAVTPPPTPTPAPTPQPTPEPAPTPAPTPQPTPTPPSDGINVILYGEYLSFDVPPMNMNGRIVVPMRAIFEAMGATIEWDGETQTVTATREYAVVILQVGSHHPTVNGQVMDIDQPGIIVDGRTLAPLRFVAEAFGDTVEWDSATQTATITSTGATVVDLQPNPTPNAANPYASTRVGDRIQLGGHTWRVLDVQDGRALLLSDSVLERRQFFPSMIPTTWESSTIRHYLNGDFFNNTFTEEKRQYILLSEIENHDNHWDGITGGNNTTDRVFLLSTEEVVRYFGDSGQLTNRPPNTEGRDNRINDQFNSARVAPDVYGITPHGFEPSWWLRSPGSAPTLIAVVDYDGTIYFFGASVESEEAAVRPALWLNIQD